MSKYAKDNESRRARYAKNPEKVLIANTANRYGITKKESTLLRERVALNKCDLCDDPDINGYKNDFCIDHCHETKRIRGVLCRKCNLALGYFNDNLDTLSKAIKYLNND